MTCLRHKRENEGQIWRNVSLEKGWKFDNLVKKKKKSCYMIVWSSLFFFKILNLGQWFHLKQHFRLDLFQNRTHWTKQTNKIIIKCKHFPLSGSCCSYMSFTVWSNWWLFLTSKTSWGLVCRFRLAVIIFSGGAAD